MIIDSLLSIFTNLLNHFIGLCGIIKIPTDVISTLSNIIGWGCWVIGEDMVLIFFTTISSWYTVKLTIGILEWIWKMIKL